MPIWPWPWPLCGTFHGMLPLVDCGGTGFFSCSGKVQEETQAHTANNDEISEALNMT